jgi:hypothetical protein
MKKKKRTAANVQRPNKRVENHKLAFLVATFIRSAQRELDRAIAAAEDSDEEREATEFVKDFWFQAGQMINFGNPAMMRLVADELEGKLHGANYDDAILRAHAKAMRTGKGLKVWPRTSEIDNAGIILSGISPWPTKRYLRHRARILGCGTSPKPGAPRKGR